MEKIYNSAISELINEISSNIEFLIYFFLFQVIWTNMNYLNIKAAN